MHVPKAAGTSLRLALTAALMPERVVAGIGGVLCYNDAQPIAGRSDLLLRESDFADADLVCGHISLDIVRSRYPGIQTVLPVRLPQARLLSHWLFWRGYTPDMRAAEPGGEWRFALGSFGGFLAEPFIAYQTDNLLTRFLIWPDDRLDQHGFIDPAHDEDLVAAAIGRLAQIELAGVIESPYFHTNLEGWLGMTVERTRHNETAVVGADLTGSLATELDPATLALVEARCRLDARLWTHVAARTSGAEAADRLRTAALLAATARFSDILRG